MDHPRYLKDPWQTRDRVDAPPQPTSAQTIAKSRPDMSSGAPAASTGSRTGLRHPCAAGPGVRNGRSVDCRSGQGCDSVTPHCAVY